MIKGHAQIDKPVWILFIHEQMRIARSFGDQFVPRLRVFLKKDAENSFLVIEGLLSKYEEHQPYHILLHPKYTINCSKKDLVEVLISDSSPLKKHFEDKHFFDKFCGYIHRYDPNRNIITVFYAFELVKQIVSKLKIEELVQFLDEDLEFSNYVEDVIKILQTKNPFLKHYQIGEYFSFVVGDAISRVEVLKYETPYSLKVKEEHRDKEIPQARDFKPGTIKRKRRQGYRFLKFFKSRS